MTEAVVVIEKSQAEEVGKLDQQYGQMIVKDEASAKLATDARTIIGSMHKGLTVAWKSLVAPWKEKVKTVDAAYKPLLDRLDAVDTHLKGEILGWRRKLIEAQQAEQRRIEAENAKRQREAEEAARKERLRVEHEAAAAAFNAGMNVADSLEYGKLEAADVPAPVAVVVASPAPVPTKIHSDLGASGVVRIVDRDAIQAAVDAGVREIQGVSIFQQWLYEIIDTMKVPDKYRKDSLRRS